MLYAGIGMFVLGFVMLQFFGVSSEEHEKGEDYTVSDAVGGLLLYGGAIVVVGYGLWFGGGWLIQKLGQLFYGAESGYVVSLPDACSQASGVAAAFFLLSILILFKGEDKYRELRRRDFAKARRIRASYNFYASLWQSAGMVVLLITVGVFIYKSL